MLMVDLVMMIQNLAATNKKASAMFTMDRFIALDLAKRTLKILPLGTPKPLPTGTIRKANLVQRTLKIHPLGIQKPHPKETIWKANQMKNKNGITFSLVDTAAMKSI